MKTCITIGIFCVIFGIGFFNAFSTKVTEVTLSSQKISHPVRILFVADLHVDDVISIWHLHTLKREISSLHPDVLLFGGDFFNTTNPQYVQYYSVLKDLTIPMFGVGGNHDHGSHRGNKDSGILQRLQTFANITLLDQETS
ncbi:metallophosphoesterase [bacterium]|nr:metallophosphoesterase [bacterium]